MSFKPTTTSSPPSISPGLTSIPTSPPSKTPLTKNSSSSKPPNPQILLLLYPKTPVHQPSISETTRPFFFFMSDTKGPVFFVEFTHPDSRRPVFVIVDIGPDNGRHQNTNPNNKGPTLFIKYSSSRQPCANAIKPLCETTPSSSFMPCSSAPHSIRSLLNLLELRARTSSPLSPITFLTTVEAELLAQMISLRKEMAKLQEHNNLFSSKVDETQRVLNQQETQNIQSTEPSQSLQTPGRQKKGKKGVKATPAPSKQLVVLAPRDQPHVPKKV
ncbi:unnamed protein product [Prunus armeniaca]